MRHGADAAATPVEHGLPAGDEDPNLVLIAEDDEGIALALEILIEDAGYRVVRAAHGEQALMLARRLHPMLVITDLMMPRMNGAQLVEMLREDAAALGQDPPHVVLMTAAGSARASEIPADAFLPKPFDVDQIFALLDRFMPRSSGASA